MKKIIPVLFILIVFAFSSCSMFSADDKGTPTEILAAGWIPGTDIYADFVSTMYTDQSYSFAFAIEDPDLDAYSCFITESGPEGYYYESPEVLLSSQTEVQMIYLIGPSNPTTPYGAYQATLKIKDKEGNMSNSYTVYYTISAPI